MERTTDTTGGPASGPADPRDYAAARLALLRRTGPGAPDGPGRRARLARLTDAWLAGLFGAGPGGTALVAVGGYGRGELSPRSDLDLLLLHDGLAGPGTVGALADRLWYPVWDLGIALDHSVRTPREARRAAEDDIRVQLGLLDARHLAGDPALTLALRTEARAAWRSRAPRRLAQLRELAEERAARHGELRFLLEPDLKEARGGLRDATALRAVAASWLADAPREGLAAARNTLLDVRDALHLTTGRATDRLALQEQDQVAAALGLLDADTLLRRVYEAARTLAYASDVTWREVGRVLRSRTSRGTWPRRPSGGSARHRPARPAAAGPGSAPDRSPLAEGVVEQDGEAVLARTARPESDPVLPLRAAAAAARAGLPLALPAVRRLAASGRPGAPARPLSVPWPAEAREEFVTLLGAGPAMVPVWEALEAEGLIAALLPDWERVRCRPQRNPVHRWTVDRHLLETAVRAAALARRVRRPDLLLVAALLHDIGKGWPGDHSAAGATIARDTAVRMGFGPEGAAVLATLVRHHLLLVDTATRRDLDDPATVRAVADRVGDADTLELLHALTEADALATGPAAWSAWRAALVGDLVARVASVLAGAPPRERRGPGTVSAEAERLAVEAWRTGGPALAFRTRAGARPGGPGADEPGRSVPGADGRADASGTGGGTGAPGAGGGAGETREADGGAGTAPVGAELLVALPERPGVLPAVAGVLALHRLTVRAADLRRLPFPGTPAPGGPRAGDTSRGPVPAPGGGDRGDAPGPGRVLLLSWRVAAEYGAPPPAARLRADLVRALDGSLDVAARLAEREAAHRRPRGRGLPSPPPRVTVDPDASRSATVIEVRARDVPGLLYRVGRAMEDAGVTVRSAHVATLGGNAVDAFYVTGATGEPLPSAEAAALAEELERTLTADG